jgi:glycosyltransferase involved in cell wall biosynthesis
MTQAWPFSVLILTLNEERNLPDCLASIRGCGDVVVLDSRSTDRTDAIAKAAGARVFLRPFDTFAGQRNFAQKQIPFRNPWVFHLDADERFTPELAAECARVVAEGAGWDGYYVAPRMLFEGRWIPHCTDFPAWQARFVQAPRFRFVDAGHGQREAPEMRLRNLEAGYLHELFTGGEQGWIEKHRRYARAEAAAHLRADPGVPWRDLFAGEALERRRALKRLAGHLPFRRTARFVYQYLLRRGFLDGGPGLLYCLLLARYEGFIAAEIRALRTVKQRVDSSLPPAGPR